MSPSEGTRRRRSPAQRSVTAPDVLPEQSVVPYDENLLERARSQWQFGDWESLTRLDRDTLQHHPDRAKLALFAAAGHLQISNAVEARKFFRIALDWGVGKENLARILIAGVHNSLGRVAALAGQQRRMLKHFESSVVVGTPGADIRLITQARIGEQLQQINLISQQASLPGHALGPNEAGAKPSPPIMYLLNANLRVGNFSTIKLGFNATNRTWLTSGRELIEYQTESNGPLYLVSNEDGNFANPPGDAQIPVVADTAYQLSGEIAHSGDNRPVIWVFQYGGGKKIDAQSVNSEGGRFRLSLKTLPTMESIAIGIRLAGKGSISPEKTVFALKEQTNEELVAYLEEKIEKIERTQKREVENSMKQIEACIRLQHYLGADTILPDMHNWPISPDFGVLLINLIEQNDYDAVIEFGSGTSTLILAKALERAARRHGRSASALLSFDHLQEYAEKARKLLRQAGLEEYADVVLAPLAPWRDDNGEQFSFYACDEALHAYRCGLPDEARRLLVIVDGPPSATGKHARYPALPKVLEEFSGKYVIHFLMDDYLRLDEQEIAARWLDTLSVRNLPHTRTEFINLEKKAFLIEVCSVANGASE